MFFDDLAVATAVGVGMHWCQYIAIIWSIYSRKNSYKQNSEKVDQNFRFKPIVFVFAYAFIMASMALLGMPKLVDGATQYSLIYLIPLVFQLYHFYIDGFIWKFSDPHIKKSILPYIFKAS